MSWFVGYTGKSNRNLEDFLDSLNLEKTKEIKTGNLTVICGGKEKNLIYNFSSSTGWIVSGIPIYSYYENLKFVKKEDFESLLLEAKINLKNIDGHFAGIKWSEKEIIFFNDQLGLREIYFLQVNSNILFSTRADWTAKYNKINKINFEEFSTAWLLTHKISWQNVIKNIKQLGPCGEGIIQPDSSGNNELQIKNYPLLISNLGETENETFINHLNRFVTLSLKENKKLSLGLSGGLDSRVLLQILLSKNSDNWQTHTFGNEKIYDGKIVGQIITNNKIKHSFLEIELPSKNETIKKFFEYNAWLGLPTKISDILIYPLYKIIDRDFDFIIDGAFGEIFRRAFLVRFSLTKKMKY